MAEHHLGKSGEQHGNEGSPLPHDHKDNGFLILNCDCWIAIRPPDSHPRKRSAARKFSAAKFA